jgi:hypothetical protein
MRTTNLLTALVGRRKLGFEQLMALAELDADVNEMESTLPHAMESLGLQMK